jgi:hypothetical protein
VTINDLIFFVCLYLAFGLWLAWCSLEETDLGRMKVRDLGALIVVIVFVASALWPICLMASVRGTGLRQLRLGGIQ